MPEARIGGTVKWAALFTPEPLMKVPRVGKHDVCLADEQAESCLWDLPPDVSLYYSLPGCWGSLSALRHGLDRSIYLSVCVCVYQNSMLCIAWEAIFFFVLFCFCVRSLCVNLMKRENRLYAETWSQRPHSTPHSQSTLNKINLFLLSWFSLIFSSILSNSDASCFIVFSQCPVLSLTYFTYFGKKETFLTYNNHKHHLQWPVLVWEATG